MLQIEERNFSLNLNLKLDQINLNLKISSTDSKYFSICKFLQTYILSAPCKVKHPLDDSNTSKSKTRKLENIT